MPLALPLSNPYYLLDEEVVPAPSPIPRERYQFYTYDDERGISSIVSCDLRDPFAVELRDGRLQATAYRELITELETWLDYEDACESNPSLAKTLSLRCYRAKIRSSERERGNWRRTPQ